MVHLQLPPRQQRHRVLPSCGRVEQRHELGFDDRRTPLRLTGFGGRRRPPALVGGEVPAAVRRGQDGPTGDVEAGGERAGDVGEGGYAVQQQIVGWPRRTAGDEVEGVHGELVQDRVHDGEQREGADGGDDLGPVQLVVAVVVAGEVRGPFIPVAAQRGEDLVAGRVPVFAGDGGVGLVDVHRLLRTAA